MRIRLVVALLLLAAPLTAQQKIDRRIAIAPDASIRITNMAGMTRITGWDVDSIAVIGAIPAGSSFFFGGKGRVSKMGVERKDETLAEPGSTLEVKVPRGARVWVKSGTANVEVTGLRGEFECTSVSGSIRVEGSLKLLIAESMEGNLNASGPMDVVRLKGGAGTITIRGARGDITATTVGGAIVAMDAAVVRAHLETVSGTIAYDGSVDPRGTLESVTHSGDVTLRLPPEIAAEFDLESFDGAIFVGLMGKGAEKPLRAKPVSFITGEGGSHIMVRSFKGEIRILKR
jgi:DUF4097 and DUF4098 domain-containing protein YvlB